MDGLGVDLSIIVTQAVELGVLNHTEVDACEEDLKRCWEAVSANTTKSLLYFLGWDHTTDKSVVKDGAKELVNVAFSVDIDGTTPQSEQKAAKSAAKEAQRKNALDVFLRKLLCYILETLQTTYTKQTHYGDASNVPGSSDDNSGKKPTSTSAHKEPSFMEHKRKLFEDIMKDGKSLKKTKRHPASAFWTSKG